MQKGKNEMVNFADVLSVLSSSYDYQHLCPPIALSAKSARARRVRRGNKAIGARMRRYRGVC
jgi:hypothetical protein